MIGSSSLVSLKQVSLLITMNCELGCSVIISGATGVCPCIFRGAFFDDQRALSTQGVDADNFPWFQLYVILRDEFIFKMRCILYIFKVLFFPKLQQ